MSSFPTDPTSPPSLDPGLMPETTTWPKVLGIIAIVVASLGLIANLCGLIGSLLQGTLNQFTFSMQGSNAPAGMAEMQQRMADAATKYQIHNALIAVVSLALAGWLLWGGIALVKRRRAALSLVYWAPLSMVVTLAGAVVTYLTQHEMAEAIKGMNATTPGTPNMAPVMSAMSVIAAVFHVVMRWPLPLVVLGFLAVGKRRAEAQAWPA